MSYGLFFSCITCMYLTTKGFVDFLGDLIVVIIKKKMGRVHGFYSSEVTKRIDGSVK